MAIDHFYPTSTDKANSVAILGNIDGLIQKVFSRQRTTELIREARVGDAILNLMIDECSALHARDPGFLNAFSDKRKSNRYLASVGKLFDFDTIYPHPINKKEATCLEVLVFHLFLEFDYEQVRNFVISLILQDILESIYNPEPQARFRHLNLIGNDVAKFAILYHFWQSQGLIGFKTHSYTDFMIGTLNNLSLSKQCWTNSLTYNKAITDQIDKVSQNKLGSRVELGLFFRHHGLNPTKNLIKNNISSQEDSLELPEISTTEALEMSYMQTQ